MGTSRRPNTHNVRYRLVIPEAGFNEHFSCVFPQVEEVWSRNDSRHLVPQLTLSGQTTQYGKG